jgi:hypothetical protein
MARGQWESGLARLVFVPCGRDDNGVMGYRIAPFEVLTWASVPGAAPETYIVSAGIVTIVASEFNLGNAEPQVGQEFGYYERGVYVTDVHLGDGTNDGVFSLHQFGQV